MSNKMTMGWMHVLAFTLVVVGALNWGLVGLMNFNLVEMIFGMSGLTSLIYILVGIAGLYLVFTHKSDCKTCDMVMKDMGGKKKKR